jgi:hypothetical protein
MIETISNESPRSRAQYALKLLEKGIPKDGDPRGCIAYHGTSIGALAHAVRTGSFVGWSTSDLDYTRGDIFFGGLLHRIPTSKKPSPWLSRTLKSESLPSEHLNKEDVILYASLVAQRHHLTAGLGLSLSDAVDQSVVDLILYTDDISDLWEEPRTKELKKKIETVVKKFGYTKLETLRNEALKQKGVLIGFSRKALEQAGIGLGDPGAGDLRFIPGPEGLSFSTIIGIDVQGGAEKNALIETLKNI